MSTYDNFDFDEDDADDAQSNPLKALRKANRAKDKQIAEMQAQLEQMSASVRSQSVRDVLAEKGLNPKIAELVPKDISSAEEVANWVDTFAGLFSANESPATEQAQPEPVSPDLQAMGRIAAAQATGQPFSSDPAQIAAQIAAADSPEALSMLLFGNPNGPAAS